MHTEEGTLKNEIVVTKGNKGERERERERERVSVVCLVCLVLTI